MPPGSARTWPIGCIDRYEHDPTLTLAGGRRHPCQRRASPPESQDALALPQGDPGWLRAKGGGLNRGLRGEPLTHLLFQGTIPQSNGTAIASYDPAVVGQLNWTHQTTQRRLTALFRPVFLSIAR